MLLLNSSAVTGAASASELATAMEEAMLLYEEGKFSMPLRLHSEHGERTLLVMPVQTDDWTGVKLAILNPDNPRCGLPVLHGLMTLFDGRTGKPLALLDAAVLTARRTAAVAVVAVRYLAQPHFDRLGIVGAGLQGINQALFVCATRAIQRLTIYDLDREKAETMANELRQQNIVPEVQVARAIDELLENAQVVITATNAAEPVLPENPRLLSGRCFVAIGSYKPHMRELPAALFPLVRTVYVDTLHALQETGDLLIPLQRGWLQEEQVQSLGRLIREKRPPAVAPGGSVLFKSVGMALFDLQAAVLIYRQAKENGIGINIDF